jgi:hypothetical protein
MKTKSSMFIAFTLKTLILITTITIGLTSVTKCEAQSIVGKWKRTGTKIFVTDKATGKEIAASEQIQQQYDQSSDSRGYKEILEIKPNNTYVITVSTNGNAKPIIRDGNYSLSGKELDMKIPPVNNQKTTITIQSLNNTKMIWDLVFMGKLTEIIYSRM